jgi:hypothetical protein
MNTITKVYTRHYRDNGQTTLYVEWSDDSCSEAPAPTTNKHMLALLDRAAREGLTHTFETW